MNCEEFRVLFARLLKDEAPRDFPTQEYRRHFALCLPCQILLSLSEVQEALSAYAGSRPARMSLNRTLTLLRRARRRAIIKKWLTRRVPAAATALLVLIGIHVLISGSYTPLSHSNSGGVPPTHSLSHLAREIPAEGFELLAAKQYQSNRSLMLVYRSSQDDVRPYELAKRIALSEILEGFPGAPHLTVSLLDQKERPLLQVQFTREEIASAHLTGAPNLPGPEFCRFFRVLYDNVHPTRSEEE